MKSSIILFIGFSLFFTKVDLATVRKEYKTVTQSKAKVLALYNKLEKVSKNDNKTLVAYKGALSCLMSKQVKGLKQKKEYFKKGTELIEYAVRSQPNNTEIILIRLSVQQNSPKFLKYNKQINNDKEFIFKHFKNVKSKSLKKYIADYILHSEHFTKEEKITLN